MSSHFLTPLCIWTVSVCCSNQWICRSSHRRLFLKVVLKSFSIFTGQNLGVLEFLFNKFACLQVCTFIKKRLQHMCFPVKLAKFLRALFWRISEHNFRGSRLKAFSEKDVLKNFANSKENTFYQNLFWNEATGQSPATLLKSKHPEQFFHRTRMNAFFRLCDVIKIVVIFFILLFLVLLQKSRVAIVVINW